MTSLVSLNPLAAKNAFKTALAVVIVIGISLTFDWPRSGWAAMTVLFLQTPFLGSSIKRGIFQILSGVFGGVAGVILISFFVQDRWTFIIVLSLLTACSFYILQTSKYALVWLMGMMTMVMVVLFSLSHPETAFLQRYIEHLRFV